MEIEDSNPFRHYTEVRKRTLSDVNSILEFAKLEKSDFKPAIQSLYFSQNLENDSVKLVELDQTVLDSILQKKSVTIRGDKNDNAVLVTESATYDLKGAETSNSLLLIPDLTFGCDLCTDGEQSISDRQVGSVIHNYFELRKIKPRLRKLKDLLMENPYRGRECEGDELDVGRKYTLRELRHRVQASDQEIAAGLAKLNACLFQGHYRMLEFEFLSSVVFHILQLCEEHDWLATGLDVAQCCQVLGELFPQEIIEHIVRSLSREAAVSTEKSGDLSEGKTDGEIQENLDRPDRVTLDEDKVCQHFAEVCLKNSGKFNLSDFLQAWQQSVPEGMTTSLAQIQGMALIERSTQPEVVWYYNVEDLPDDVAQRFEILFEERKKWSLEEITPYIIDLTTDKLDVGALLTKHARSSMHSGIKVFSSRKTLASS